MTSSHNKRNTLAVAVSALVQPLSSSSFGISLYILNSEANFIENKVPLPLGPHRFVDKINLGIKPSDWLTPSGVVQTTEFPEELRGKGATAGLQNSGAICFLNALFQALSANPTIAAEAVKKSHSKICSLNPKDCGVCCFENFMAEKWKTDGKGVMKIKFDDAMMPEDALNAVGLQITRQGDSSEAWNFLLNRLDDFMVPPRARGDHDRNRIPADVASTLMFNQMFGFLYREYLTCTRCGSSKQNDAIVRALPLPIKPGANLSECLKSLFCNDEILENEDAVHCAPCGAKCPTAKSSRIINPPNYLVIQYKRFLAEKKNGSYVFSKNDTPVDTPKVLDLSPCMLGSSLPRKKCQKNDSNLYEPYAAVIHQGNLGGGHYVAVTKAPNGTWYLYNDSRTSEIKTDAELKHWMDQSYMLFYRRVSAVPSLKKNGVLRSSICNSSGKICQYFKNCFS